MIENKNNETRIAFVRCSKNAKCTGIPVTTSTENTCPWNCGLFLYCYGRGGNTAIHWKYLNNGVRKGLTIAELCEEIRRLPKGQLWRHDEAGDLDGDRYIINLESLRALVAANRGRSGFTYTHYDPILPSNAAAILEANTGGFTVNLSADTEEQADRYAALGIAPVVMTIAIGTPKAFKTRSGNSVITCLHAQGKGNCSQCKWCAMPNRKFIVGFPAHGYARRRLSNKSCNGIGGK